MMTVACVQVGNYCGRGADYVERLRAAVRTYLPVPHRFVCVSDDLATGGDVIPATPGLPGWWQKLSLFRPGLFAPGLVLYLDLDTFVLGDLSRCADYRGDFAILRDVWKPAIGQSAVMLWREGFGAHLWAAAEGLRAPDPSARLDYALAPLTPHRDYLQDLYPGMFVSYKAEAQAGAGGAAVVFFHGRPRPHEAQGWAAEHWARAA